MDETNMATIRQEMAYQMSLPLFPPPRCTVYHPPRDAARKGDETR